jgi:hypothetical protein
MVGLVETMLKLHSDLPKAETTDAQESLKRTIAATDNQIEALAIGLYGLTADDIRSVEGTEKS